MFLTGEETKKYVTDIIHEETQLSDRGVDLTVNRVAKLSSPTDLDFGGGEEVRGRVEKLTPRKRSQDDSYGWWNLEGDLYIIDFNEDVNVVEGLGIVAPLNRLTAGGSFHSPILFTGELDRKPVFYVNSSGLSLKENARVSQLKVWI